MTDLIPQVHKGKKLLVKTNEVETGVRERGVRVGGGEGRGGEGRMMVKKTGLRTHKHWGH